MANAVFWFYSRVRETGTKLSTYRPAQRREEQFDTQHGTKGCGGVELSWQKKKEDGQNAIFGTAGFGM